MKDVQEHQKNEKVYVLDCRQPGEYISSHIPGAIYSPLDANFAIWSAFLVDPRQGEKIILVAPPGREEEAITRLARTGLDCVIGYLDGGYNTWQKAGQRTESTDILKYNSAEEFEAEASDSRIIDVRNQGEWAEGVHPRAELLTLAEVKQAAEFSASTKDTELALHCKGGVRSLIAASLLHRLGFTNVRSIDKGSVGMANAKVNFVPQTQTPITKL